MSSTRGKIGRGKQFFEAAFGCDEAEFQEILMMPEALIIRRFEHDEAKRRRFEKESEYADKCDNITDQWREKYNKLNKIEKEIADGIINKNRFTDDVIEVDNPKIHEVLSYYQIQRVKKIP